MGRGLRQRLRARVPEHGLELLDGVLLDARPERLPRDNVEIDEHPTAEHAVDLRLPRGVAPHQPLESARLVGGVVVDVEAGVLCPAPDHLVHEPLERGPLGGAIERPDAAILRLAQGIARRPAEEILQSPLAGERIAFQVEEDVARRGLGKEHSVARTAEETAGQGRTRDPRVEAAVSHWAHRFVANGVPLSDFQDVTAGMQHWDEWCPGWSARAAVRALRWRRVQLPAPARGSAALSALSAHVPQLAAAYGKSTDELAGIFLRDNTLWTDTRGRLFYGCEFGPAPVHAPGAENADAVLEGPLPYDQTFLLHSRPSATRKIYLDFDGQITSGTAWNGGQTIVSAPYDSDGNTSSFSNAELDAIQYIWQRVAEDYAPFDVDVTTEDPGTDGLRRTSSSDAYYGMRVVISPTNWYNPNAGGVAYVGVFNYISSTDVYGTCWVFTAQLGNGNEKYVAEAASHEVGHTLGLSHDGVTGGSAYYSGQGNWAPIMGVGYYKAVTQWSKGEYAYANNLQDDLAGKKVGIIERQEVVGGVCINTGTIPSKSLREAVLYLSGFRQRNLYGAGYRVKAHITIEDLAFRANHVIAREIEIVKNQMSRNRVDMIQGKASFVEPHRLRVEGTKGAAEHTADFIIIAVGTQPARPADVPFDDEAIIDTDGLLRLKRIPDSIVIVGGGVIGTEYASILAAMGIPVTLIDKRPRLLEFVDAEIIEALQTQMKDIGVTLYHEEEVLAIAKEVDRQINVCLQHAKPIQTGTLMYAVGREGATEDLNLEAIGLKPDQRGRLHVNAHFQTAIPHIYAAGDVIGLADDTPPQGGRPLLERVMVGGRRSAPATPAAILSTGPRLVGASRATGGTRGGAAGMGTTGSAVNTLPSGTRRKRTGSRPNEALS